MFLYMHCRHFHKIKVISAEMMCDVMSSEPYTYLGLFLLGTTLMRPSNPFLFGWPKKKALVVLSRPITFCTSGTNNMSRFN